MIPEQSSSERQLHSADVASASETILHLHAGHIVASDVPCTISTVLGSCVSVCLFDSVHGIGGANHFLLPTAGASALGSLRFGRPATEQLVRRLVAMGCRQRDLQAKVFGGADVLGFKGRAPSDTLGAQNVHVAKAMLEELRIPLVAEVVGGSRGRKLLFRPCDGEAWVRTL
jgi:chemotaxis protein CheD